MRCDADRVSEWRVAAVLPYDATPDQHFTTLDLDLLTGFKTGRSVCGLHHDFNRSEERFWDKRSYNHCD